MRNIRIYLALIVIAALLTAGGSSALVLANEVEQKQQELNNVQQQMANQASKVQQLQGQVDTVADQLRGIEENLAAAQGQLEEVEGELAVAEKQVEEITETMIKVEASITKRNTILNKRIRDIYENGQISYLEVLLGAKDFSDFTSRVELLKRVVSSDLGLLQKIKAERELLAQKKAELDQHRIQILAMKKQAEEKRNVILVAKRERASLLSKLESQRDVAESTYNELLQTSRDIETMIRRIRSGGNPSGSTKASGQYGWPTSGPVTSPFGWRVHPVFGTQRFHTGIDIGADYGEPIVAADGGVVINAEWIGGYGKTVIIDHNNGYSTLYAHASELLVSEGQTVGKGQIVSRVGSTGYSTGPHLHFEIRQNGSPINPLDYLP